MPRKLFQKGNKFGKGAPPGGNPGAGRPMNWLKQAAQEGVRKHKLLEKCLKIAKGENVESFITPVGEVIPVPPKSNVQLDAIKWLAEQGWGKATQAIEVSGDMEVNLIHAVKEARRRRGIEE